jgi:hypothetical protein
MGSFMPLPFGNRERSPRQLFSAETTTARVNTLQSSLQLIDAALQQGQFPGMSFDEQAPAVQHEVVPTYPTAEIAAGAAALQTVEAPEPAVMPESEIFHAQSLETLIMNQTVEMDQNEFTQAA